MKSLRLPAFKDRRSEVMITLDRFRIEVSAKIGNFIRTLSTWDDRKPFDVLFMFQCLRRISCLFKRCRVLDSVFMMSLIIVTELRSTCNMIQANCCQVLKKKGAPTT